MHCLLSWHTLQLDHMNFSECVGGGGGGTSLTLMLAKFAWHKITCDQVHDETACIES